MIAVRAFAKFALRDCVMQPCKTVANHFFSDVREISGNRESILLLYNGLLALVRIFSLDMVFI